MVCWWRYSLKIIHLLLLLTRVEAIIERGYKEFTFRLQGNESQQALTFNKSMYSGTSIILEIRCETKHADEVVFKMAALLSFHRCHIPELDNTSSIHWTHVELNCRQSVIIPPELLKNFVALDIQKHTNKRLMGETCGPVSTPSEASHILNRVANVLPLTKSTALYRFDLKLNFLHKNDSGKFKVRIEANYRGNYLSVIDWPLLQFFGVLSFVYLVFGIAWFIAMCRNWTDLLDVQFWIGGVIAIGLLENVLFYIVYRNMKRTGGPGNLLYFAEIVSCMKRAVAYITVILISVGFGIVRPRRRQTLTKVIVMCVTYYILASVGAVLSAHENQLSTIQLYMLMSLTAIECGFWIWIFLSLLQTRRILKVRKDIVKLNLYLRFTFVLIFTVIALLAYTVWTIKEVKFTYCIDIGVLWLNQMLRPSLLAVLLSVVMVLWKPIKTNQMYAFRPLGVCDIEDDADDLILSRYTIQDTFEDVMMMNKYLPKKSTIVKS